MIPTTPEIEQALCKAFRSRRDTVGKLDEPSDYLKTRRKVRARSKEIESITITGEQSSELW